MLFTDPFEGGYGCYLGIPLKGVIGVTSWRAYDLGSRV